MAVSMPCIIVSSVLNLALELLCEKVGNFAANNLKDGDVTHQEWRKSIVRELNDITTKLDGLARKDLLSSISFLREGLCLLNLALPEAADISKHASEASSLVHVDLLPEAEFLKAMKIQIQQLKPVSCTFESSITYQPLKKYSLFT